MIRYRAPRASPCGRRRRERYGAPRPTSTTRSTKRNRSVPSRTCQASSSARARCNAAGPLPPLVDYERLSDGRRFAVSVPLPSTKSDDSVRRVHSISAALSSAGWPSIHAGGPAHGQMRASADVAISNNAAPSSDDGSSASISKHGAHQAGRAGGAGQPDRRAGPAGRPLRPARDDGHWQPLRRAPRAAQSPSLAHVRRHHGIETNRRQQQRGGGKDAREERVESRAREEPSSIRANGGDAHDAHIGSTALTRSRRPMHDEVEGRRGSQHEHLGGDEELRRRG